MISGAVGMEYVVDKIAVRRISVRVFRFFPVIPPMLHARISFIYHRRRIILAVRASLTFWRWNFLFKF